jgi:hypothetical protein
MLVVTWNPWSSGTMTVPGVRQTVTTEHRQEAACHSRRGRDAATASAIGHPSSTSPTLTPTSGKPRLKLAVVQGIYRPVERAGGSSHVLGDDRDVGRALSEHRDDGLLGGAVN